MSVSQFDSPLVIRTKLYPPRSREGLLVRDRLIEKLRQGGRCCLTLVSAPAGYGKTTLLQHWLSTLERRHAWLSIDEYDDSLTTFVAYLTAAVQTVYPEALPQTRAIALSSAPPEAGQLADVMAGETERLPGPLILVLDDYHAVRVPEIHAFMNRLLEHLPPGVQLVVSSRTDPPFALAGLRGQGQLVEIRGRHLRFTREESADLLQRFTGDRLADPIVALVAERTEGWPVGLQLAALSLQDSDDREEFARRFAAGSNRLIAEYLMREVLDNLPEARRSLMLRTSILDRLCAPLCAYIAADPGQRGDGDGFIGEIWAANLFLTSLDSGGTWYRYHHLFRDMMVHQLQQRCAPEEIAALHLRASQWYEAHDLITEAVIHAVRSGHDDQAAQMVERHFVEALDREDWRLLERWLSLLPEPVLQRPMLLVARAYLQQFNYAGMITFLDQADQALSGADSLYSPEQVRFVRGSIALLRAFSLSRTEVSSPEQYLALSHQGLELLAGHNGYARGLAELSVIVSMQHAGQREAARTLAQQVLQRDLGQPDARTLRLLLALCLVHYAEADIPALHSVAQTYLQFAQDARQELSQGWATFFLGWTHYQRSELTQARDCFAAVVGIRHAAHSMPAVDSLIGMMLTLHALGDAGAAREMVAVLRSLLLERRMVIYIPIADALGARLADGQDAGGMLVEHTEPAEAQAMLNFWTPPALVKIAAVVNGAATPSQLAAAEEMLPVYRRIAQTKNSRRHLLTIGALETLLYDARGNREAALNSLHATVLLGAAGGALRVFVDAGARLIPYLRTLLERNVAPEYVRRILAAYGDAVATTEASGPVADAALMFTARELDVLRLLDARMTDKEIARALCVSTRTVQRHTSNIYEKLHVHTRQEAVAAARTLGINL